MLMPDWFFKGDFVVSPVDYRSGLKKLTSHRFVYVLLEQLAQEKHS